MAGSILPDYSPSAPTDYGWPVPDRLIDSAEQFLTLFHQENNLGSPDHRIRQVRREIEFSGSYWHTPAELVFGARVAWRNSSRCIGRLYWRSLRVRDRREISSAADIAAESVTHLRDGDQRRPDPAADHRVRAGRAGPARAADRQLAAHPVRGLRNGRRGRRRGPGQRRPHPAGPRAGLAGRPPARPVRHPAAARAGGGCTGHHCTRYPATRCWRSASSTRSTAGSPTSGCAGTPCRSSASMYLDIGGVCYPAAPFNGWYMGTEIGSRDLGDTGRYDQLPVIAPRMGLSTATDRTLWKDKALTELNLAVLHSFDAAGVTITDHHTESAASSSTWSGRSGRAGAAPPTGPGSCRPPRPRPRRSSTATTRTSTRRRTSTTTQPRCPPRSRRPRRLS